MMFEIDKDKIIQIVYDSNDYGGICMAAELCTRKGHCGHLYNDHIVNGEVNCVTEACEENIEGTPRFPSQRYCTQNEFPVMVNHEIRHTIKYK